MPGLGADAGHVTTRINSLLNMLTLCGSIGATLGNLTDSCLNIGQIQKLILTRKYSSGTTLNKFTISSANPNLAASWTSILAASDGTKAVVSPTISNPQNESGSTVEYGSGNEVPGGVPIIMGYEPGKFTCELLYRGPVTLEQLRKLEGETLTVYFIAESGNMYGKANANTSPTTVYGIDIQRFKVSDRILGGRDVPDKYMVEFYLPQGWADYLYEIVPATGFNPLTDLAN